MADFVHLNVIKSSINFFFLSIGLSPFLDVYIEFCFKKCQIFLAYLTHTHTLNIIHHFLSFVSWYFIFSWMKLKEKQKTDIVAFWQDIWRSMFQLFFFFFFSLPSSFLLSPLRITFSWFFGKKQVGMTFFF